MTKIERSMQPVEVDAVCECGGRMRASGAVLLSHPPQFPHRCNGCGREENLRDSYPYIKHVAVSEDPGIPIYRSRDATDDVLGEGR